VLLKKRVAVSYLYLFKWTFIALLSGAVGVGVVRSFFFLLNRTQLFLLSTHVPLPVYTVLGAVLAGAVIYKIQPDASGEGMPSYLQGIRRYGGNLDPSVTLFKYFAALSTLATFGNGGIVGPLGRVSSGAMSWLVKNLRKLGFDADDLRTASICGMASAVGAIFHTVIGGGLFAVEIIQKDRMNYRDIFPAILASLAAVVISGLFGFSSFYGINPPGVFPELRTTGWILLLSVLLGIAGGLYTKFYSLVVRIMKREEGKVLLKVVAGSAVASSVAWLLNPGLLGTSNSLISGLMQGNREILSGALLYPVPIGWTLIIMLVLKAVCNCITVGSGMSAGFTGPAALLGMMLGSAYAFFLGFEPGSGAYFSFLAAGFSGMLASSMNIPLASAVMTVEIFGLKYSLAASLAAIIGFQINRHQTIYDFAVTGAGSGETG